MTDAGLSRYRLPPRRHDRHVARDRAAIRRGRNRAACGRDRPRQRVPAGPLAQDGRSRPARHHGRRGAWRHGDGLSRARDRDGGSEPGVGGDRPLLRRALEPVREPDPAQRHAGTEAQVPAEARFGRARGRAGDERARRRLRRRVDAVAGGPAGRSLRPQRQQDVDHQRSGREHARRLRQDGRQRRAAGGHRVPDRARHEGIFDRAEARQAGNARLEHVRARVRQTARSRRSRCWGRRAAASTC